VLYVLFAFVVPIVYNLILSFEQTSPATISSLFAPFAGLSNYKATLVQPVTQSAIARTFIFTAGSLIFQFIIGFSLALLFNLRFPFRRVARSLIIIPWLLRALDVHSPEAHAAENRTTPPADAPATKVLGHE